MTKDYTLGDINTRDYRKVAKAVIEIQKEVFPASNSADLSQLFEDVSEMFNGEFWEYQPMDTFYHDLEHTLQVTLCWARMIANRAEQRIVPIMTDRDFEIGLHGVMLHDIGFLKENGDSEGTGAKFTYYHEKRGCKLAYKYLKSKDWAEEDISGVQHLISCTGPRSNIDSVPFNRPVEHVMGESVCTSDYLGQMSDPCYLYKLPILFYEFEESDNYRNVPVEKRLFKNTEELIRGTPGFWKHFVMPKLEKECHGIYKYLAHPYPEGDNQYIDKINEHINVITKEMDNLSNWKELFGKEARAKAGV